MIASRKIPIRSSLRAAQAVRAEKKENRKMKRIVRAGAIKAACAVWCASCAATWGAAVGVSYTHYRFKIDAIYGSSAIGTQISELALLCDGENVTRKHLGSVARAESVPRSVMTPGAEGTWNDMNINHKEGVAKAIDGTTATKFYDCNASPVRSNAAYRDMCWVELAYTNALRVTAYRWATADDSLSLNGNCRTPTAFRLQGSDDGETWTDIDVQANFAPPTTAFTWTRAFPVGGATDVGGYATDAKWFRWTVRRKWRNNDRNGGNGDNVQVTGAEWSMQVGSFELYDAAGNNLANGLVPVAKNTAATALNPGEATACEPAGATHGDEGEAICGFQSLFDGNPDSKYMCGCVLDTCRRITVTMRLSTTASPVTGYGVQGAYDAVSQPGRNPARWTLDASYDGETWFTLDERAGVTPPVVSNGYFNAGLPYPFQGAAPCGREIVVGAFDAASAIGNPIPGAGKTVRKVGSSSYAYAGGVPGGVDVEGGSLAIMPSFTNYRFKMDALNEFATSAIGAQFGELMLFDDWTNVTHAGRTAVAKWTSVSNKTTGAVWGGHTASWAVDRTFGNWFYDCNLSVVRSYDPFWDNCYAHLTFSTPRRVSQYVWATGGDCFLHNSTCRSPRDFRLQGSNDGETWTDLDVRTDFAAPTASNTWCTVFTSPGAARAATATQGTSAKYFRLTIKSKKNNGVNSMQFSEFGLFDRDGVRVNTNLTVLAQGNAATALAAGEATAQAPRAVNVTSGECLQNIFDEDTATKFLYGNGGTFNVNDSSTWLVITMRLRDDAPDVYGYGFATANDAQERDPDVWLLEASADGTTWTKLDERSGYKMTTTRLVWDTYAMPFADATPAVDWCVSNVCVAAGASLRVGDDRVQIGGLTVDCAAGGGAIDRLNAAETGTLNLVNATGTSFAGYSLPLTIGTLVNGDNVRRWTVSLDGVPHKEIRAKPTGAGGIVFLAAGTTVFFR